MKRTPASLLGLLCLGSSGCSSAPPPPPPPPPPPAEPSPPPPPLKCEAMKERCKADANTRARIPGTNYAFTPPKRWVYAQLEEATVTQQAERGPVLVLTTYEPVHAVTKRSRKRTELIASLAELVGVEPQGGSVVLFRPNERSKMAGLDMLLWERPGAHRADDEGSLLVLESDVGERKLFGVGYAPASDAAGTSSILAAIESVRPGDGATSGDEDTAGSERNEGGKK